jgi:serine protease inhibitor
MAEPEVSVDLALPKFESSYEDSLVDDLSNLGMAIAFDPARADFSQMNDSHEKNLYIGEVKHKTFVRVDEKGTEAAAVTSVEMRVTSLPMSDKQIVFDRPFIYGILDVKTGVPLFVGILDNPAN